MTFERNTYLKILGERIRGFRIGKNMTQAELADKSGLHTVSLSSIERGVANPSILTLRNIAHALQIRLSELLYIIEDESPSQPIPWGSSAELATILIKSKSLDEKNRQILLKTIKAMLNNMEK
ncbi:hypothetical protein DRQ33_07540 [bacterium]|nr:MAG: hypothetical protein DRQ33_07540 [bacterium]